MGVDTKIYLENHANVEKVYDVLAVILGAETEKTVRSQGSSSSDLNEPASNNNDWDIKIKHDLLDNFNYVRPTYFEINIKSVCGEEFNTLFFYDIDDNEYAQNGERLLNPRCSGAWLSIGKKTSRFFWRQNAYI